MAKRTKTYNYRLELNGKQVEAGCTASLESIRSAALYNAKVLHHHEIKVYAGPGNQAGGMEYLGTCHPDGSYFDSFNKLKVPAVSGYQYPRSATARFPLAA